MRFRSLRDGFAVLVLCAAAQPAVAAPRLPTSQLPAPLHRARASAGTCPKAVIFVADGAVNSVDVYPLKGKNQNECGQISATLSEPQGLAADTHGQLYIATTTDSNIPVYAGQYPPGTLARTISDPGFFPSGVAVSEPDGLVAAINICSAPSCGAGSVAIYKKGATTPCDVVNATQGFYRIYFGAFDAHDNVYIDGESQNGSAVFGEISGGCQAKTITPIALPSFGFPGLVAVDKGGNIAVGDQDAGDIAVFAPGDFDAPLFTLTLQGASASCAFVASGKRIWCSGGASAGAFEFKYPKGGAPINQLGSGLTEPIGIAISPALVPGG